MHQHRIALHRNSDTEPVTMTVELPTLKQRNVNVEAHGKHLSLFLDFKRSENHDKGERMVREHPCGKVSRTW
jgi:HSP20 family molecular chaperone IbpA